MENSKYLMDELMKTFTNFLKKATGYMPYRSLGRTGERVSVIGLGGYHIGNIRDFNGSTHIIREALDRGMNFLDNCWSYHDGESERRMGWALRDGYRDKAFLMTKFDSRSREGATRQIDQSLERLDTDCIDLIQYHENIRMDDPDKFFEGPVEAVLDAQGAGKVRYIGFTGHKHPRMHMRMLELADKHGFHFDACQMPINVMDAHYESFAAIIPEMVKRGIGVIGMKPMGGHDGEILKTGAATATECLHYALSLPISTIVTGIESMSILEQAFNAVQTSSNISAVLERTKSLAMTGRYEGFKTTTGFDGTYENPDWML